ncbi:hypothetical protein [Streptomyces virginiae]|uniref:hypothetical protein n=1 Tax=Streptomyces virginiae TaxID=1961 RepID=UPI00225A5CED|nr:hypothetical protein [Streptomyces virginiae]MCX5176759.1 hypothetical protein [Streptomyces virginiae]
MTTPYADACDLHRERILATPLMAIPDGDGGIVAGYRCPACRATWTCSWQTVPGQPVPPEPAAVDFLDHYLSALVHEQAAINRAHKHTTRKDR